MTLSSIPLAGQYIFRIYQIRKLNFPPIRPQKLEAINDEECNHRPERRLLSFRHPYSTRRKPCSLEGATTLRSFEKRREKPDWKKRKIMRHTLVQKQNVAAKTSAVPIPISNCFAGIQAIVFIQN